MKRFAILLILSVGAGALVLTACMPRTVKEDKDMINPIKSGSNDSLQAQPSGRPAPEQASEQAQTAPQPEAIPGEQLSLTPLSPSRAQPNYPLNPKLNLSLALMMAGRELPEASRETLSKLESPLSLQSFQGLPRPQQNLVLELAETALRHYNQRPEGPGGLPRALSPAERMEQELRGFYDQAKKLLEAADKPTS